MRLSVYLSILHTPPSTSDCFIKSVYRKRDNTDYEVGDLVQWGGVHRREERIVSFEMKEGVIYFNTEWVKGAGMLSAYRLINLTKNPDS